MSFSKPELWITAQYTDLNSLGVLAPPVLVSQWALFLQQQNKTMTLTFDRVTGKPALIEGQGIPWIPGTTNSLTSADLGLAPGLAGKDIPLDVVSAKAIAFINQYPGLFGIDTGMLSLNKVASGSMLDYLYFVDFNWSYYGVPVEKSYITFRVNHGNLIQFGQEFICDSITKLDRNPSISLDAAWAILWNYVGGIVAGDAVILPGQLSVIPVSTAAVLAGQSVAPGGGLDYRLIYTIAFRRPGVMGSWQARIDAHAGEILSFLDADVDAHVMGGAYRADDFPPVTPVPYPYADCGGGVYADAKGICPGTTGTSTLSGKFVKIQSGPPPEWPADGCGDNTISRNADSTGLINFSSSSGRDCVTPGVGGDGNTHAARTAYWNINQVKIKAMSYFTSGPAYSWLQQQFPAYVNLAPLCKAEYDQLDDYMLIYKSEYPGCNNYGEIPGIMLHEWGHGLDYHDGTAPTEYGSSETYGDFTAVLQSHQSCFAKGLNFHECTGYNDPCLTSSDPSQSCTGQRDLDYTAHQSGIPVIAAMLHNASGFNCYATLGQLTWPNDYGGPCRYEAHCESAISSQALWDLSAKELPSMGIDQATAWQLMDRLWYTSRGQATSAYQCTTNGDGTNPVTTGCGPGSLYTVFRAIDDCGDGPDNGTPHAAAIFHALDLHRIACGAAGDGNNQNHDSCCTLSLGAKPIPSGSVGACQNNLSWTATSNATRYYILRNEVSCSAGFTRIATVSAPTVIYNDTSVSDGTEYYYRVQAAGDNDGCVSAVSNCVTLKTSCGTCNDAAVPNLLSAVGSCFGVDLLWSPGSTGTTRLYYVYRKLAPCGGGYSLIAGPKWDTSYRDTTGIGGITYAYAIRASCDWGGTTLSAYSTCVTATPKWPLQAPGTPTVTDACNGLNISWSAVPGATEYYVYEGNGGCSSTSYWPIVCDVTSGTTSCIDTVADPGQTYGYYIGAYNSCFIPQYDKNHCASGTHAAPDISGKVTETTHNKITGVTSTAEIQGVPVRIMNYNIPSTITNDSGNYSFQNLQGFIYHINAYKVIEIDGNVYEFNYNPGPWRSVTICKNDMPDQNFWLDILVVPFTGSMKGPVSPAPFVIGGWTITAASDNYFASATTDEQGNFSLSLPAGTYQVYAQKQCTASYPPYLTASVGDVALLKQNFLWTGWQTCTQCYPTLFKELQDCGGLVIGGDECIVSANRKFQGCALAKTQEATSYLYNATILSVEVQRSTGKPEEQDYAIAVSQEGDYYVNITDGDGFDQKTVVSSADISLDPYGPLFGPSDFNKNLFLLKKQVHLLPGAYTLKATLRSQPDSYLTIVISNVDIASFPDLP